MLGRRGQGEGSIYKDHGGRWRAVIDLGWADGKRQRKYLSGQTRREVQAKLDAARRDYQQGLPLAPEHLSLEQFLLRWLEDVQRLKVEPSTYAREATVIRKHLIPAFGKRPLAKLTPQEIQAYQARALRTLAPKTLRLHHSVLHNALATAVRWGIIARNPAALVELPKLQQRERRVLDAEPARRLLRAARDDPREALYVLALTTGMRIGELMGLQWDAVDLDAGALTVQRKLLHLGKQVIEGPPKSTAGRRRIELHRLAVNALRRHRDRQREQQRAAGGEWARPDLVFTTDSGQPQRGSIITGHFLPQLLERAGLPRLTFHELRHSMITLMLSRGESISVVAQMVGHSSVAMTLAVYRHILPNEQRAAVERLGDLLAADDDDLAASLAARADGSPEDLADSLGKWSQEESKPDSLGAVYRRLIVSKHPVIPPKTVYPCLRMSPFV
jgi:integrase